MCLSVGFYQLLTSNALAGHGVLTEATVVDRDSWRKKMTTRYRLTLEFDDAQGVEHRERTDYRADYGRYQRGETVLIRYNPNRPDEFAIDGSKGRWFGPLLWCAGGLLALAAFAFAPRRN